MDCDSQRGKNSDSSDSRRTFIILMFSLVLDSFGVFLFLFLFSPNSVVVVDFIGL